MADGGDKDVKQTQAAADDAQEVEGKQAQADGGDKDTKPAGDEGKQAAKAAPTDDRYQKYREAYIRERLRSEKVKDGAEMDAALSFVTERLDDDDINFDDVLHQLKVRMRLDKRKQYVDPVSVNPPKSMPQQRDLTDLGRKMFDNLKKKGLIR